MIGVKLEKKLKVALVHDYLNQYGDAEKVLECLAEMFPEAPIYTLFYDKKLLRGRFKDRVINTSFLDNALVRRNHRLFIPLFPKAAEFINLKNKYDLIISDSHGFAKGVSHTKGVHISYIHAPLRYGWELENYLKTFLPHFVIKLSKPIISYVRRWDYGAAQKPHLVLANSHSVAAKIKDYYNREAKVIHPPVDEEIFYFNPEERETKTEDDKYFLAFERTTDYKGFDMVVEAFNKLDLPLILIGAGPHKSRLEAMAKSPKIKILPNHLSNEELAKILREARALIFPQVEGFGLTAAEAVSAGVPVIAYAEGSAKDIIEEGKNGVFFKKQHPDSIVRAVASFLHSDFDRKAIHENAKKFSKTNFKRRLSEVVQGLTSHPLQ